VVTVLTRWYSNIREQKEYRKTVMILVHGETVDHSRSDRSKSAKLRSLQYHVAESGRR
jgi:hypothetical protein